MPDSIKITAPTLALRSSTGFGEPESKTRPEAQPDSDEPKN
jgi:hypothetical protein